MANKHKGQLSAPFRGDEITLTLSIDAICELEDAANAPITDILDRISDPQKRRFKDVRLMFWAMMLDAMPDATTSDASELMGELVGKTDKLLTDAIAAAFPDPSDEDGGAGK